MKSLLIILAWILLGVVGTTLIAFIPGALDLIDDARLGRLVARYFLGTAVLFGIAGVLFVGNKRRGLRTLKRGRRWICRDGDVRGLPRFPSATFAYSWDAVDDSAGRIAAAGRELNLLIRVNC